MSHPLYGRRAEKTRRLQGLVEGGLPVREAAARVGVAPNTAYSYLADPDGARYRAKRERRARGRCEGCGEATSEPRRRRCARCSRTGPAHYWTPELIVEAIRLWALTYGAPPLFSDWSPPRADAERRARYYRLRGGARPLVPGSQTVVELFGSWNAGIRAAGFEPLPPGRNLPRPPRARCRRGHEMTEENTYVNRHGHRLCRACARESRLRNRPPKGPRTRCRRGHALTPGNVYVDRRGWRRCRTCVRRRRARYRHGLLLGD